MPRRLSTNQIFSHPTTGTVTTTTEIWRTETKVLVSLLMAEKITPNSKTHLLLVFSIVRYHKMLIIGSRTKHPMDKTSQAFFAQVNKTSHQNLSGWTKHPTKICQGEQNIPPRFDRVDITSHFRL